MKAVYICNDSVTGIFSAVYDAWKAGGREETCGIAFRGNVDQQLFCTYCEVEESEKKAEAVERMILKHLGSTVYRFLYYAALSNDCGKGNAILGTMMAAREIAKSTRIMEHLSHPMVEKVFKLSRNVGGEAHLWTGFLRFRELYGGILFSKFKPKNRILTCIAPHFSDRLPAENWMIYDMTHQEIALHEAKKRWVLTSAENFHIGRLKHESEREEEFSRLWKEFVSAVSVKERRNRKCQMQHLPLWYRENMVEFDKKCTD